MVKGGVVRFVVGQGTLAVSAIALLALSACGREADQAARPDAQAQSVIQASAQQSDSNGRYARASYPRSRAAAEDAAPALADGKPAWASSRRYSPTDSEQRQFERNGGDFSAKSADDYVAKAHAFVDSPPAGVLKATRANGDVLYYDPKANVFAVVDKQGAPRTMFKPREGMAYWTEQKQSLADNGGSGRRSYRRGDNGSDRSSYRSSDRPSSSDDANG
jgi:hypothetical protein